MVGRSARAGQVRQPRRNRPRVDRNVTAPRLEKDVATGDPKLNFAHESQGESELSGSANRPNIVASSRSSGAKSSRARGTTAAAPAERTGRGKARKAAQTRPLGESGEGKGKGSRSGRCTASKGTHATRLTLAQLSSTGSAASAAHTSGRSGRGAARESKVRDAKRRGEFVPPLKPM